MGGKKTDYRLLILSAYRADAKHLGGYARWHDATENEKRMAKEAQRRYRNYRRMLKRQGVI